MGKVGDNFEREFWVAEIIDIESSYDYAIISIVIDDNRLRLWDTENTTSIFLEKFGKEFFEFIGIDQNKIYDTAYNDGNIIIYYIKLSDLTDEFLSENSDLLMKET